jgi:hypothetical protein
MRMRTRVRTRSTFHANSRGKIALINRRTAIELLVGLDFDVFHPHAGTAMRHACPMRNKATVSPLWQSSSAALSGVDGLEPMMVVGREMKADVMLAKSITDENEKYQ